MNNEEKIIIKIISDSLGVDIIDITPESHLQEDLNAQDLEIADLLMKLEREFHVSLSQEEAKTIQKVKDIIDLFKSS